MTKKGGLKMNKKLIIAIIGILAILSLGAGIYYATSLYEQPIENITINNNSENSSNDNIDENTTSENFHDARSSQIDNGDDTIYDGECR